MLVESQVGGSEPKKEVGGEHSPGQRSRFGRRRSSRVESGGLPPTTTLYSTTFCTLRPARWSCNPSPPSPTYSTAASPALPTRRTTRHLSVNLRSFSPLPYNSTLQDGLHSSCSHPGSLCWSRFGRRNRPHDLDYSAHHREFATRGSSTRAVGVGRRASSCALVPLHWDGGARKLQGVRN
jgi:hypothetical protein